MRKRKRNADLRSLRIVLIDAVLGSGKMPNLREERFRWCESGVDGRGNPAPTVKPMNFQ